MTMNTVEPKNDTKVKIATEVIIKFITRIEMPHGERFTFDRKLAPEDMNRIQEIWGKVRTEEMLRIEQNARTEIFTYLQSKGYNLVYEEKIQFV